MASVGGVGDGKRGARHAQAGGNLGRAPVKAERGPSARLAHHLDLQPVHAVADARSQGLGACLLGGKARGKALRRPCACAGNRPAPRACRRGRESAARSDPPSAGCARSLPDRFRSRQSCCLSSYNISVFHVSAASGKRFCRGNRVDMRRARHSITSAGTQPAAESGCLKAGQSRSTPAQRLRCAAPAPIRRM